MSRIKELKEICFEANMEIPRRNLAIYTFGNVSAYDTNEKLFAIKPSGVEYSKLKADDMVLVDLDGKVVEGSMRPSSDTKTHAVLYKAFPSLGGIVHTHSTYAVAWAQACCSVPIYGTTHADHLAGDIPVTDVMSDTMIKGDYEEQTGYQILTALKDQNLSVDEVQMILVASHGPFTWGSTPEKAVYNAAVLEELCRMALFTEQIKPGAPRLKQSLIDKHYQRKHGKDAYYGQA
ncbi:MULTISPECIES: L-ribulose-5-phosphate 4-epimerase [unclassified Oceanispirochaeta]|uniref:L-ribulose-5-phosphate 4-epimerase n=1 Tax=unclassified Oceanispirochaeta TaxID=2635722 RepID=UPI000E09BE3F|nr:MULTISPECIES: L-ribulose-5-phosphate 4-epimerase [unclassified Oceanispirochaeta]NPD74671.1 L-ribulose-5-phosphate 4-epimerase [Oceanispirochaeta sp. M1]RDG29465.1 L-ribulose-5-phosphate 4-epimerase [Oceanispirochaeta sp. M1]